MKTRYFGCLVICALIFGAESAQCQEGPAIFNSYILKAVDLISRSRSALGYGPAAFTRDLVFGDNGVLKASKPPITMCVAAQLEVLIEAINLYAKDTGNYSPFHFVPKITWERLRPNDLRGQIWIVDHSPAQGAGDAFQNFGMGNRIGFRDLKPGSFLNFNRNNRTGHAVIFLAYLDKAGNELREYSSEVAGFKYFSSQGAGKPDGGFGYRWGFFSQNGCPSLDGNRKRDCGIIYSETGNLLVGGNVYNPANWDQAKAANQILRMQEVTDPSLLVEGEFNSDYFTGVTTDD
jgi:hypothetical protein